MYVEFCKQVPGTVTSKYASDLINVNLVVHVFNEKPLTTVNNISGFCPQYSSLIVNTHYTTLYVHIS